MTVISHSNLKCHPSLGIDIAHIYSDIFHIELSRPPRKSSLHFYPPARTMATLNSQEPIPTDSAINKKERAITSVTKLLAKLKQDEPTSHQDLMNLFESIKEINKPTKEKAVELFKAIETKFPHRTLGGDKWYLVVVSGQELDPANITNAQQLSALAGVDPDYAGDLYTFLINKPEYKTPESRKSLMRHLREALVKNVSVQGVCKPLEALFAIEAVERPEDRDFSFSR